MSLLWRDQVRIVLCPSRLVAIRLGRGYRPKILAKHVFHFLSEGKGWQPALLVLAEMLKQDAWQRADATVIISGQFARYQLLPWSGAVLNEQEQQVIARHNFSKLYGEPEEDFDLRISEGGLGASSVVVGIAQGLTADLQKIFNSSSLKLISMQPYLMAAFNDCRRKLSKGCQWFVLVEQGLICAALLCNGEWKNLRTKQVSENWLEELKLLLHREKLLGGVGEQAREVYICELEGQGAELPANDEWSFQMLPMPLLPGFSQAADKLYGMALAGVA